jgi:hypothetical protein
MRNVYEIVDARKWQADEKDVLETYSNAREAKKALRDFYHWHPDEIRSIKLLRNGKEFFDNDTNCNIRYQ